MASLKIKYAAIIISSLIAGGLISVTAWQYVNSSQKTVQTEQKAPERKVLFWYDPMKPDTKFDKPGKSPFMDMDLVPKYADDSGDCGCVFRVSLWFLAPRRGFCWWVM
ncbi:hypothetical protein OFN43_27650, partial [Escherichia coli]|nr:hypothetical protein [Escherichia coli]